MVHMGVSSLRLHNTTEMNEFQTENCDKRRKLTHGQITNNEVCKNDEASELEIFQRLSSIYNGNIAASAAVTVPSPPLCHCHSCRFQMN